MKETVKAYIQAGYWRVRAWEGRHRIDELASQDSSLISAAGQAIREALNQVAASEEKSLLSLIELRRRALMKSDIVIPVVDYGAGSPGSNRTKEEMAAGVATTARVSSLCRASKPELWGRLLFKLVRKLRPASCLELGSCVGISASYMASALHLNDKGRLSTLEGAPEIGRIAKETLEGLGLDRASVVVGPFHKTYPGALQSAAPVDFVFNDGHHDYDATLEYFFQALPYLADESVMIFDDISWSPGMRKAWNHIENHERVGVTVDLHTMGIAFISKYSPAKRGFRIKLW